MVQGKWSLFTCQHIIFLNLIIAELYRAPGSGMRFFTIACSAVQFTRGGGELLDKCNRRRGTTGPVQQEEDYWSSATGGAGGLLDKCNRRRRATR